MHMEGKQDWKSDATHTPDILDVTSILYACVCVGLGGGVGELELTPHSHLMYESIKFLIYNSCWKHGSMNTQIAMTH